MKSVYMIEYRDDTTDSYIERSAFNTYQAASYFLLNMGYDVSPTTSYNFNTGDWGPDINWNIMDGDTVWLAEIYELTIVE